MGRFYNVIIEIVSILERYIPAIFNFIGGNNSAISKFFRCCIKCLSESIRKSSLCTFRCSLTHVFDLINNGLTIFIIERLDLFLPERTEDQIKLILKPFTEILKRFLYLIDDKLEYIVYFIIPVTNGMIAKHHTEQIFICFLKKFCSIFHRRRQHTADSTRYFHKESTYRRALKLSLYPAFNSIFVCSLFFLLSFLFIPYSLSFFPSFIILRSWVSLAFISVLSTSHSIATSKRGFI